MEMALPLIRSTTPGLYVVLANANIDYPVPVPAGAQSVILWFETSATNPLVIGGRVGIDQTGDVVTGLDNTESVLGYMPASVAEYTFRTAEQGGVTQNPNDRWLHLACPTAGAVVRGMYLFREDTGQ